MTDLGAIVRSCPRTNTQRLLLAAGPWVLVPVLGIFGEIHDAHSGMVSAGRIHMWASSAHHG